MQIREIFRKKLNNNPTTVPFWLSRKFGAALHCRCSNWRRDAKSLPTAHNRVGVGGGKSIQFLFYFKFIDSDRIHLQGRTLRLFITSFVLYMSHKKFEEINNTYFNRTNRISKIDSTHYIFVALT